MRVAIIDLDGIIADSTERFRRAEAARQAAWTDGSIALADKEKTATQRYWREAFNPELVALDTLIEGACDAMERLTEENYRILFLSSRPESMRAATLEWLFQKLVRGACDLELWNEMHLVMKAPTFQYVKTTAWKVGIVATLQAMWNVEEVVFIDDEMSNITALREAQPLHPTYRLLCCTSLPEAVGLVELPEMPEGEDEDPFLPA